MVIKKSLLSFLVVILLFSGFSFNQFVKADESLMDKEEFLKMVKQSEFFKKYKSSFIKNEPVVLNPVTNENQEQTGYIAQYEIEYN